MTPLPPYIARALKSGKTIKVKLEDIGIHEEMQPRDSVRKGPPDTLTRTTIQRYTNTVKAKGIEVFPPITLAHIEDMGVLLVDGWHRYEAHKGANKDKILATVQTMTLEGAQWQAAKANQNHGRPIVSKDYRETFRRYIVAKAYLDESGKPKSYRKMAEDLGHIKAHTTIRNWVREDFPKLYMALTSDEDYADEPLDDENLLRWKLENAERYVDTAFYKAHENLKTLKKLNPESAQRHIAEELEYLSRFLAVPVGDLPDWLNQLRQKEKEIAELEDF